MPKIANPGIFKCPKCFRGGMPVVLASLASWKTHMTKKHGGFTDAETATAAGTDEEGVAAGGGETFEQAAASMPNNAEGFRLTPPDANAGTPRERAPKPAAVNKAIAANLQQVKQRLAETIPMIFGHWINKVLERPQITDEEMKKRVAPVSEAIQTVLNALGVDIQIEPMNTVIKSRLWLIFIPVGALIATFFTELMAYAATFGKDEEETPATGDDQPILVPEKPDAAE